MKSLQTGFFSIIASFFFFQTNAQTVQWAHKGTSQGYEYGNAVTTDDSGNVYVSGQIEYTTHFDNGQNLSSYGIHDIFAGKYGPDGTVKWLRNAGGTGGDVGYGVAVDNQHNCYVTGEIEDVAHFSSSVSLTSNGGNDIFISKYNANGSLVWAKSFGSTESDKGYSLMTNSNGDVFLTGFYSAHIYFDNIHLTPAGLGDVYTMKLNSSGVVQWAKKGAGSENDKGKGITFDRNGNVYVAGFFTDQATFSGNTINNNGTTGGFLVKYDASGQIVWLKGNCCGTSEYDGIAIDADDNIYTTGYFTGTVTLGSTTLTSSGNSDILIVKYDPSGNIIWAKKAGGPYEDIANGITVDSINEMFYITGQLDDHGYFDSKYAGAAGNRDVYIAAYDLNGNCQWVKPYGGVNRDIAYGIASDRNGYICTTGIYTGSATFGSYSLTGNLLSDYYVDKVSPIPVAAPTSASTNLVVTNSNCNDLSLSFTPGNGAGRIIIARAGSAVNQSPVNGATYHANASFGSGDNLGSGNYIVYNGTGNAVNVTGLSAGTTYYFSVFEYNGTGAVISYLTNNPAVASQTTGTYSVNIQSSLNSLCVGDTVTLTASGGGTYSWSPSASLSSSSGNVVQAFPVTSTTYTVITNINSCQVQNVKTITVNQLPVVSLSLMNSLCENNNAVLLTGGLPSGGIYNGTGVVSGMFDPSISGAGIIPVSYLYTDGNGCSGSAASSIEVLQAPVVTLSLINSICENERPVILSGGSPSGGNYTGSGVISGTFDPAVSGAGSIPVSYLFTDGNGCSDSATSTITVLQSPNVTLALTGSICENASPVILAGGLPTGGIYTGSGVVSGSFDPALSGVGTIPLSYSFTAGNGCSDSAVSSITVFQSPVVALSFAATLCENGNPVQLTGGTPGGGVYSGSGVVAGYFDPALSGTGSVPVLYSYTDANGCTDAATSMLSVISAPVVSLGNDTTVCADHSITLDAGSGFSVYNWSTGSIQSAISLDSIGTGLGTASVFVEVANSYGCSTADTIQVTFSICSGIENSNGNTALTIYPNPFTRTLHLSLDTKADIYVYDATGKLIEKLTQLNGEIEFGSDLASGVYSVIVYQNEMRTIFRVIKK
ncbi:MAG: SBBP repeat-containing protein [Bacteroidetes bacterium]|nr:SBBP repeat-containing protein [Bacteroidota bacterium]